MLTPRPYQVQIESDIRAAFRGGAHSVLLVSPTASGKTFVFSRIAHGAAKKNKRVTILVHRAELLEQCSRSLDAFGVPHGLVAASHTQTHEPVQVASVQTFVRRLERVVEPDLFIVDECFPAGTMVDGRPIETFSKGDTAQAFNHAQGSVVAAKVNTVFMRIPAALCKITLDTGRTLVCTPNHPIYSKENACYIPAASLHCGSMVLTTTERREYGNQMYAKRDLYNLRGHIPGCELKKDMLQGMRARSQNAESTAISNNGVSRVREGCDLRGTGRPSESKGGEGILLSGMQKSLCFEAKQPHHGENESKVCLAEDDRAEPNEKSRGPRESIHKTTRYGMEAYSAGRERKADTGTPDASGVCIGMGDGGRHTNARQKEQKTVPHMLQGGHREFCAENSHRGKWIFPLRPFPPRTGQKENLFLGVNRVESVDLLQPGSDGTFGGLCPDGFVYNLEVTPHHNYFANGILVHNCHHTVAGSWRKIIDHFPRPLILGVTATPIRLDGQGLGVERGGYYDTLVAGPTVKDLTEQGFLAPAMVYAPPIGADMSSLHTKMGDFDQKEAASILDRPTITGCAVQHYKRICPGVPAIAFCTSIEHAEHTAEQFRAAGIPSESIDGTLDDKTRKSRTGQLADGRIRVLASVDVISEGYDVPVVTTAILLRPTQSLGLYLQQVGRCLRIHPAKSHSIILDHVGNVFRHGFPDDEREWDLNAEKRKRKGESVAPTVTCEKCFFVFPLHKKACPECGWVRTVTPREITQVEGELERVENDMRFRMAKKKLIADAKTLEDLEAVGRKLGYKRGWAHFVMQARQNKRKTFHPLFEGV